MDRIPTFWVRYFWQDGVPSRRLAFHVALSDEDVDRTGRIIVTYYVPTAAYQRLRVHHTDTLFLQPVDYPIYKKEDSSLITQRPDLVPAVPVDWVAPFARLLELVPDADVFPPHRPDTPTLLMTRSDEEQDPYSPALIDLLRLPQPGTAAGVYLPTPFSVHYSHAYR